jgi:hypothetical protein
VNIISNNFVGDLGIDPPSKLLRKLCSFSGTALINFYATPKVDRLNPRMA